MYPADGDRGEGGDQGQFERSSRRPCIIMQKINTYYIIMRPYKICTSMHTCYYH